MITNIASPGSSCATTAEPTATLRTDTRDVRSSMAEIGSAANSGARAIVARILAGSSPATRASGTRCVPAGRVVVGGGDTGRAIPSVIGKAPVGRGAHRSAITTRAVPERGTAHARRRNAALPHLTPAGSVIDTSQLRAPPGRGCRGRHTWSPASLTRDLGLPAPTTMLVSPPMSEGIEVVIN